MDTEESYSMPGTKARNRMTDGSPNRGVWFSGHSDVANSSSRSSRIATESFNLENEFRNGGSKDTGPGSGPSKNHRRHAPRGERGTVSSGDCEPTAVDQIFIIHVSILKPETTAEKVFDYARKKCDDVSSCAKIKSKPPKYSSFVVEVTLKDRIFTGEHVLLRPESWPARAYFRQFHGYPRHDIIVESHPQIPEGEDM